MAGIRIWIRLLEAEVWCECDEYMGSSNMKDVWAMKYDCWRTHRCRCGVFVMVSAQWWSLTAVGSKARCKSRMMAHRRTPQQVEIDGRLASSTSSANMKTNVPPSCS